MRRLESLALRFSDGALSLLDQRLLPRREAWFSVPRVEDMVTALRELKVRGAPLIGVSAALFLAQRLLVGVTPETFQLEAQALRAARPTAVNLMYAIDQLLEVSREFNRDRLIATAFALFDEDVELCDRIGQVGQDIIEDGDAVLTHCNTGGLATAGRGTALGVIQTAWERGKRVHVFIDETRPLLQGARLTAWELKKRGIPYTLICDAMAATVMAQKRVTKVLVGADRIARNGDFANKVGTYGLAVLARAHSCPFYVAAPRTTVDLTCATGDAIPIESRPAGEVRGFCAETAGVEWAPADAEVFNPGFDVTPAEFVTGWILEDRVHTDPRRLCQAFS